MDPSLQRAERPNSGPRVVWAPQDGSQHAFLSCPIFEVLYEGSRGGGKTDTLLMDFGQHVGVGFGAEWKGILFRQTYPQLQDVIGKSKKWFWQIWPDAKYNEALHQWSWPTGEMLLLRQFDKPDDYWNYHGHAYPWVAWEELCNWATDEGYKRMMSTIRSTDPRVPRKCRATTNPYGNGHNWVKHRWRLPGSRWRVIDDAKDEEGRPEPMRVAIPSSIYENKILLEADPDYINRIIASARNEAERKAWLEGSWDIVAGGMFDDLYNPRVHLVKPFRPPPTWRLERSLDMGSSKPFSVGWHAISDGSDYRDGAGQWRSSVRGDMYRIAELYGWTGKPNEGLRLTAGDIARRIIEREIELGIDGQVQPGFADSAIYTTENGICVADDMAAKVRLANGMQHRGVTFQPADKSPGSRVKGWEQVRQRLRNALPNANGMPRERPGYFVFDTCDQFQRVFPVTPRDQKKVDDVDDESEDHLQDEVRYAVAGQGTEARSGKTVG